MYGENSFAGEPYSRSSSPTHIASEDFASNALLKVTLVFEERQEDYKRNYYAFVTAMPSGKITKNGKDFKTYLKEHKIAFKLEIPQLLALSEAVRLYAFGSGQKLSKKYVIWADPSKSEHASEESKQRSVKSLSVVDDPDKNNQGGRVVNLTFQRGKLKAAGNNAVPVKDDFPAIVVTFSVFDALALSITLRSLADQGRALCQAPLGQSNQPRGRSQEQAPGRDSYRSEAAPQRQVAPARPEPLPARPAAPARPTAPLSPPTRAAAPARPSGPQALPRNVPGQSGQSATSNTTSRPGFGSASLGGQ